MRLFADLTGGAMSEDTPDEAFYRSCIGGIGLGARVLADRISGYVDGLGSKTLNALAVRAAEGARILAADSAKLKEVHRKHSQDVKDNPFQQGPTAAGTGGGARFLLAIGDALSYNWTQTGTDSQPTCTSLDSANMDVQRLKSCACATCAVRCGAIIKVDEGPFAIEDEIRRPE